MSNEDSSAKKSIESREKLVELRPSPKRYHQYREQRIILPDDFNAYVSLTNYYGEIETAKVVNISRFGARIEVEGRDSKFHLNETIKNAVVTLEDIRIYSGPLIIVNESLLPAGKIAYGITFSGTGIDPDQVAAIVELGEQPDKFLGTKKIIELSDLVNGDFKELVADLNTIFQDLKQRLLIESQRISSRPDSENYKRKLEEHAVTIALSIYAKEIHKLFDKFESVISALAPEDIIVHKKYFRTNFHPSVLGAGFVNRAYSKPLGYAGDFGLMVMLYEYEDLGANLFEKFFHRFSCNEPAAVANKNRVELLADMLSTDFDSNQTDTYKITSVASGPAKELQLFLEGLQEQKNSRLELVLIDHEPAALDYARAKLNPLTTPLRIQTTMLAEDAVLGFIKQRPFIEKVRGSKVIIVAGLFDYLSDRVAQKLVQIFYDLIEPGGIVLIGNVSKKNPDRFSMDFFAEWNLILRDNTDLLALVPEPIRSNKANKVEVISESLDLNLFLRIEKKR